MGKLVTYAIGYTTVSPYAQEIKDLTRHYERELKQNRYNKAAHIAQCLAETILEGLDVVDPDLPESEVERDRMKAIKKVAEYSTFSVKYFDQETEQEDMAKSYLIVSKAYFGMKAYDLAIKCSHRSLSFIVDKESNKVATQRAYKLIGDIYFTKACDPRAARYDDLINSKKSYLLEKKVLDTMDREDVDKDPEVWMNLKRMSYFNLGVIESKLYTSPVTAMECLTEAIELAKKLGDHGSQREAWWEMANFYKRTDDYVKIKQCLMKEMEIIRQYNLVEHEVACLMERIKVHMELEDYAKCYDLAMKIKMAGSSDDDSVYMETMAMIDNFKEAQACLVHGSMDSTDEIRELVEAYVRLCSLQYDHQLFHACLRTIDMGIKVIGKRESDSELCLLKAELMLFRGNAMWELKEYSMDELMDVNNEALQFIEVKMKNKLDRLENVIRMYDLRIKIFKYYNQQDQLSIYQQLKTNMENEYNKLQDEEEKMEYSMPHRIPKRIENHVEKRSYSVRVKVIMSQTYQLLIPCHDMYKTVECLMSEISKRTWDLYGIEPHIQRLTTMDCDLYKKDLLRDVIKNDNQYMEAHANGSVTKSPYDLYTNACERLKITTSKTIADHLEGQQSSHNSFKGLNIGGEQRTVIAQVIKHIPDPNIVDLSSNNLDDGAVELLLQDAKAISELNLTNNHLTTATVRMLIRSLPNGLQKLKLSYNRIGPDMLIELPDLFKAFPHLRLLELEGTYIGKYTDYSCKMDPMDGDVEYMDEDTNEFFQPSLVLKLGHNHFDKRVFSKWIDSLSRIHILNELNLTGITSDQPLPSFDLCRLSSLNILNLAKCSRRVFSLNSLNYMMFNHPSLSEIDVSYWNLSVEDVDTLFDGIDLNPHMKSIHLRYNPGVGDKGILKLSDLLYGANVQMLDIAGCQLTKYSMDIIMDWIRNGRFMEIDMTDNNQLITSNDQLMQFIKEYDGSRLVIRMSAEIDRMIKRILPGTIVILPPFNKWTPF